MPVFSENLAHPDFISNFWQYCFGWNWDHAQEKVFSVKFSWGCSFSEFGKKNKDVPLKKGP